MQKERQAQGVEPVFRFVFDLKRLLHNGVFTHFPNAHTPYANRLCTRCSRWKSKICHLAVLQAKA